MTKKPPWEQNGLLPMVNITQIALAKSRNKRRASYQSALMDRCLLFTHVCLIYLVVELVLVFCRP